jgi:hypothetical protein
VKALLVVTDSEAVPVLERALAERHEGFTVLPSALGSGKSGLKSGDRVHPGSSSLIFTVLGRGGEDATLAALRKARDGTGCAERTRIWSFDVEPAD